MVAVIWIGYTTQYRDGGARMAQVARTMARELGEAHPEHEVICEVTHTKREVVASLSRVRDSGRHIAQLHLVCHSGMYGPMFGTTRFPEQFSPHEWRELAATGAIALAPDAVATFHACRSARWFAPFFARTFQVQARGYHWYTAFSCRPDRFALMKPWHDAHAPLYLVGCPGKKSHGVWGSLGKHAGLVPMEQLKRFDPAPVEGDASYDSVATLYDEVFADIRVRADEWAWLSGRLDGAERPRVLDIGCGNGALLVALSGRISAGVGVDVSSQMIGLARRRAEAMPHLRFETIDGPRLPFEDDSFDVVSSFLSFRYLDWDPIMAEIVRVLRPGGRLLVVDMVTAPLAARELGALARAKAQRLRLAPKQRAHRQALARLVRDPSWATMLRYNPIRAEHELRWYLESRFPGRAVEVLNVGWTNRVLAFDSGPLFADTIAPQRYP